MIKTLHKTLFILLGAVLLTGCMTSRNVFIPDTLLSAEAEPLAPEEPITIQKDNEWTQELLIWGRKCQMDKAEIKELVY